MEHIKMKKQFKREQRLQAAKQWLLDYDGKNIVKGYRKHFQVDIMCAISELQMLGREISHEYIENVKKTIEGEKKKRENKKSPEKIDLFPDSDDTFYYITGYTSGGAPFGLTWEEMGLEPYTDTEGGVPYGLFNDEKEIHLIKKFDNPNEPDDELPF